MTKAWSEFYREVQPHVPGCPEDVIDQHLLRAAQEFCKRSEIWRVAISETTVQGQAVYEPFTEGSALLENTARIAVSGRDLTRVPDLYQNDGTEDVEGVPLAYGVVNGVELRLFPTPDAAYQLTGVAVLKPSTRATGVEDFIYDTYERVIANGSLASLMMIPDKQWSNTESGMYYRGLFYSEADNAKRTDLVNSNLRVRNQSFA